MTPAIVASAVFVAACAVFAIAFVGARGGLDLPIAATDPPVAAATDSPIEPTEPPQLTEPPPTLGPPTAGPTIAPTAAPTAAPTVAPTVAPTIAPSAPPFVVPTLPPGDPLRALDECEDHPGCFVYVVVRGDTLSGIISRYLLDIDVLEALNPGRLTDPSLVVVGQVIFVGRDPLARLDPCPNGEACALYAVQPGDSIAEIADRYLLTRDAILDANPGLPRPITAGQVLKLPR